MRLKDIFTESFFNRQFELMTAKHLDLGYVNPPVYLSVGTEHIAVCIQQAIKSMMDIKDVALFPQHRCHSYYLSFNGDPIKLAHELCGLPTGCNKGMGGSASVSNKDTAKVFGHSGLLGDQVPIAAGYAQSSNRPTICIMGDAAAEEDYALAAMGFAQTKKAPILFICEDNDLSILTEKAVRRSWNIVDVANGLGVDAVNIPDTPQQIYHRVLTFLKNPNPTLLNINCVRHLWHAGSGNDGPPEYDILSEIQKEVNVTVAELQHIKDKTESIWINTRNAVDEYRSRNN